MWNGDGNKTNVQQESTCLKIPSAINCVGNVTIKGTCSCLINDAFVFPV